MAGISRNLLGGGLTYTERVTHPHPTSPAKGRSHAGGVTGI